MVRRWHGLSAERVIRIDCSGGAASLVVLALRPSSARGGEFGPSGCRDLAGDRGTGRVGEVGEWWRGADRHQCRSPTVSGR